MYRITKIIFLLIFLTLFYSCESDSEVSNEEANNLKIKNFLAKKDFNPDELIINRSEIIYQNDLILDKKFVEHEMTKGHSKQRKNWLLVTSSNISNIFIKVDSSLPYEWRTALESAVSEWNSISSTSVHMYILASGSGDMEVKYTNIPSGHIADAKLPSWGNVGDRIRVNPNFSAVSWAVKKSAMVHELGHSIGFRHTNTSDGLHISGTATTDASSIMNSGVGAWSGFSFNDKKAVRILYP
jgi:hypothetical protein